MKPLSAFALCLLLLTTLTFAQPGVPMVRMAAWHETVGATDEVIPASAIFTYVRGAFTYNNYNLLAKLVPGIESEGVVHWASEATELRVEDFPGGVRATFKLAGVSVTTELVPLPVGRETPEADGAALYTVTCEPRHPLVVQVGGQTEPFNTFDWSPLRSNETPSVPTVLAEGLATYTAGLDQVKVALSSSGEATSEPLRFTFPAGVAQVMLGFGDGEPTATKLAKADGSALRAEVDAYYNKLLECRISTPEPKLDAAFRSALYNLEYNWIAPYGWLECIHHWLMLWHMQHTAGVEWLGQADRSASCTLYHGKHLLGSGAVPQLSPAGQTHRDFGGSNQFWGWQARHYWHFTGDLDFAQQIVKPLDKVLRQTYEEYDQDDDGLLGWGLQIGNQEDFVATPWDGTTPTIEGINLMKTRAELARALDDEATAKLWESRATEATSKLKQQLWLPDLGRFAFFKDAEGYPRLDGQYHSLLYPALWGITDELGSYTTVRHLRDRLTGESGAVYCSNNFGFHYQGTWGMQAGAAQQPWAAWTLSATGRWNETWRPLAATAGWVMDGNHRGSWPEIAEEATPAYFTPPAGLFVAATVEALFGLEPDLPAGVLEVAPSFPDHWPKAEVNLPDYRASYSRDESRLTYTVESASPLVRELAWRLPIGAVKSLKVNGKPLAYTLQPEVGHLLLVARTKPESVTTFAIELAPANWTVQAPGSIAEGEPIEVEVSGLELLGVADPCGVLASAQCDGGRLTGEIRRGQLAPYAGYGRLGQLTFARRTFFLTAKTPEGLGCWLPVDLALLPRYEVGAPEEAELTPEGLALTFTLRNNMNRPLQGEVALQLGVTRLFAEVEVPTRGEVPVLFVMPKDRVALCCLGDNEATLTLPSGEALSTILTVRQPFIKGGPLARWNAARLTQLALPEEALVSDIEFSKLRSVRLSPVPPWGAGAPLAALEGQNELAPEQLPGLTFKLPGRRFVPISWRYGTPEFRLPLGDQQVQKLFLLVVPLLENHDMYAEVAQVSVRGIDDVIYSRRLHFPGDLDQWTPPAGGYPAFSTAPFLRTDRFGLLPQLAGNQSDWAEGIPPEFPQPAFWSKSLALPTSSTVLNVIEVDLGRPRGARELIFSALGTEAAFGLVAVVAQSQGASEPLAESSWELPPELRAPGQLFDLTRPGARKGWELEGSFEVAVLAAYFSYPTLNSLAKGGEQATGRALSPVFELPTGAQSLLVELQGGRNEDINGKPNLALRLLDGESGEVLATLLPPATHIPQPMRMPVEGLGGHKLRFEITDQNTGSSFAWIGLKSVGVEFGE